MNGPRQMTLNLMPSALYTWGKQGRMLPVLQSALAALEANAALMPSRVVTLCGISPTAARLWPRATRRRPETSRHWPVLRSMDLVLRSACLTKHNAAGFVLHGISEAGTFFFLEKNSQRNINHARYLVWCPINPILASWTKACDPNFWEERTFFSFSVQGTKGQASLIEMSRAKSWRCSAVKNIARQAHGPGCPRFAWAW